MDAIGMKIARKFKLAAAEVDALRAAGFDTPRKIKDANPADLPAGLAAKLQRAVQKAAPVAKTKKSSKAGQG